MCLFLVACEESGARKGEGVGKYGMMPEDLIYVVSQKRYYDLIADAGFADITAADRRPPGDYVPNQMEAITEAIEAGRIDVLLTLGSNMLSSFPDTTRLKKALKKTSLVVAYDIFANQTTREVADIILPGTIWLEEIGIKATNTHVYLSDTALPRTGDVRPLYEVYQGLADRLNIPDVYPWQDQEAAIDAVLDHPGTGHTTVKQIRANAGRAELKISHVAHPTLEFQTPTGKIEFRSTRAEALGVPDLPEPPESTNKGFPLSFAHGRTFAHFHAFYDHARALPTLAAREEAPELWLAPEDAALRGIANGDSIRMHNNGGDLTVRAKVTKRIPKGTVWMRDGWPGQNALMDGKAVLPMAVMIEWMAHGAIHNNPGLRFHGFNDLRVLKGVTLEHGQSHTLQVMTGRKWLAKPNGMTVDK